MCFKNHFSVYQTGIASLRSQLLFIKVDACAEIKKNLIKVLKALDIGRKVVGNAYIDTSFWRTIEFQYMFHHKGLRLF